MNAPNYEQNDRFLENYSRAKSMLKVIKLPEYLWHWSLDSDIIKL